MIKIREAVPEDAGAICRLLRRSISELCVADHKNDPAILDRWLSNKTPETIASWILDPTSTMFVVTEGTSIISVGSIMAGGEIALNYVLPEYRFKGISRALVRALEVRAKEQGNSICSLSSTGTARRFYLSLGYNEKNAEIGMFGVLTYPMVKSLQPLELGN